MIFKKKNKEPKTMTLVKTGVVFTTIDGEKHIGYRSKWLDYDRIDVEDDRRCDIISQGYILDNNGTMYPLNNILSVDVGIVERKTVIDDFYHEWQWCFSNEEVEKMTEYHE